VVGLPEKLFFGTGIPASILILNKAKPVARRGKVLFIDASPEGFYEEGSKNNRLRLQDILRIAAVFNACAEPGEVPGAVDALCDAWLSAAERHHKRQLKRAAHSDAETKERIRAEHDARVAEINEAAEAVRQWLRAKNPGGRTSLDKFAAVVTLEEIADENDYNLNISRYVESADPPPQLDVKKELARLRELETARDRAEREMDRLLKELGYGTK